LNFKCKTCNGEFPSIRANGIHSRHRSAQGTICSVDSSKTEITFTLCRCLATGILRQHSLANLGVQHQVMQIIHFIQIFHEADLTNILSGYSIFDIRPWIIGIILAKKKHSNNHELMPRLFDKDLNQCNLNKN
jgi:hypothetical protein